VGRGFGRSNVPNLATRNSLRRLAFKAYIQPSTFLQRQPTPHAFRGLFPLHQQRGAIIRNLSAKADDDLRVLLEKLYPNIHIANSGVALLAAQIADLENRCDLMHDHFYYWPDSRKMGDRAADFLMPPSFERHPQI
jgi:hypothetical protein